MADKGPISRVCADVPKIHKPKPKKLWKKYNNIQNNYNKKGLINNKYPNSKQIKLNERNKNFSNYMYSKKISFNLDLISLDEINKDFKDLKSKIEDIEVQKELIKLIRKDASEIYRKNSPKIIRPINPLYKYIK